MDTVKQFLRNESARAKFTIVTNGKKYPGVECILKFLFIQFGTTSLRGFLFMPDYKASSDGKTSIIFTHKNNKQLKIKLLASNPQDITTWNQFAINSNNTFSTFLDYITNTNLAFEQNLGIPKHEYILKITSDYIFTLVDSGKCIINYQVSSRTTVTLSNFDDEPRIGLYDFDPSKTTWMTIPDLDGIFCWTLLLKCCVAEATKKEEDQFKSLEIQDISEEAINTISESPSKQEDEQSPSQVSFQTPDNSPQKPSQDSPEKEEKEASPVTKTPQFDSTAVPNIESAIPPPSFQRQRKRSSSEKDLQESGSTRNRRLSIDAHSLNKYNLKAKKQMDELMTKKSNYRKTINIPEPIPEPEIEPPVIVNYSRISSQNKPYVVVEKEPIKKMTKEDLMKIIQPYIEHPLINFNRYIPDYDFYSFKMPAVEYIHEEDYQENFKSLFYKALGQPRPNRNPDKPQKVSQADPKLTFLLLSTLVGNGFRGQSIADAFKVPKQSSTMYDILSILRKYKKDIFNFMLSIDDKDLQVWYAPWSILRSDRSFIIEINEKFVKSQQDNDTNTSGDYIGPLIRFESTFPMPESVPFQFAFKPIEFLQKFLFDAMYFQRISYVNPVVFVTSLSKMIYSLFNHYLVFEINESSYTSSAEQISLSANSFSSSYYITNPIIVSSIITSTVTVQSFVKDVLSKIKPLKKTFPPWSYLTFQQDFSQSWTFFWASCFQENLLAENFSEFFKYPELLRKFYYPCSSMRNCEWIEYVTEILNAISHINLSKNFEINASTLFPSVASTASSAVSTISNAINDNKILKNIAGFIGIH